MSCPKSNPAQTRIKTSCCPSQKNAETMASVYTIKGLWQNLISTDWILWGSFIIASMGIAGSFIYPDHTQMHVFVHSLVEFGGAIWWGVLIGIIFAGILGQVPKEYFTSVLGQANGFNGLVRATFAGLFLDVCSHGILLVAAQLYERGVSLPQVMAFMIASPWNSLSLTLVLISLIGWEWTLAYVLLSLIIALTSGLIYQRAIARNILPRNPNKVDIPDDFNLWQAARRDLKTCTLNKQFFYNITISAAKQARILLRWLLLSIVLAAIIRATVPPDMFMAIFGPTMLGLLATLGVTTILEVCSEGSAPLAADIVTRAQAPGNGFAFLMAGIATDYTEIMITKEFSKSWLVALSIPVITVPQTLFIAYIMNMISG